MNLLNISLETTGMAWLRFRKKCFLAATESGWPNHADVLGYDGEWMYEIEVKRSFSDFKADFKKLKKHKNMDEDKGLANYFYYLVDEKIAEKCLAYLKDNGYTKYGLMIPTDYRRNYCESLKPALRIHNRSPHISRIGDLQKRMSSEMIGIRLVMDSINGGINQLCNEIDKSWKEEEIES